MLEIIDGDMLDELCLLDFNDYKYEENLVILIFLELVC